MKAFLRDQKFIKEINRIYHEEEAELYDAGHPEIFEREEETWRKLSRFLPAGVGDRRILDIGSGTGFVAEMLLPHLTEGDALVLTDISSKMLAQAKRKLRGPGGPALEFSLVDAEALPFPDFSFDVVTMNSVLHHLPDTARFLAEAARVLRPGGVLIIAHEPNRAFFTNAFLRLISWFLQKCAGLTARLKRLGERRLAGGRLDAWTEIYRRINQRLREGGFTADDLLPQEIQSYVDFHSPTAAGGADASKGFAIRELLERLPGCQRAFFKTRAHLGKINPHGHPILFYLDALLSFLFPASGSSLSAVFRKEMP